MTKKKRRHKIDEDRGDYCLFILLVIFDQKMGDVTLMKIGGEQKEQGGDEEREKGKEDQILFRSSILFFDLLT